MEQDRPRSLSRNDNDLVRHDREREGTHARDRHTPGREAAWPKDDRRSSSRLSASAADHLTQQERASSWPLG